MDKVPSPSPTAAPDSAPGGSRAPDLETMLTQLQSPDPQLRMKAARIFCDWEEPRSIDRLIELLADPCVLVRVSAAYALGRNTDARAVDPLIEALRQDFNGYVRKGLVWALGNSRDQRALLVLVDVLQHDITAVRLWAASALGQLAQIIPTDWQGAGVVDPLIVSLSQDPVAAVRSNAAWALGKVGEHLLRGRAYQQIIQGLITSLQQDIDLSVRDDARLALQKLVDAETLLRIEEA